VRQILTHTYKHKDHPYNLTNTCVYLYVYECVSALKYVLVLVTVLALCVSTECRMFECVHIHT
jgi:hypothetical protein